MLATKENINRSEKGFLKLKNAAKYVDMSEKTFRKYVMPFVKYKKLGNNIYFSIRDIEEFMNDIKEDELKIDIKIDNILEKIV